MHSYIYIELQMMIKLLYLDVLEEKIIIVAGCVVIFLRMVFD